ncbi:MAG: 2'-5' RNA ligase family protein [Clostridiales bacterium]|nr:2'-5' RNA ligase family protein [Clostridiales bacterium]
MAEEFLTLMADLDEESQARMAGWYAALREAGFRGTQTPGLPYHISLATFPLDGEREAVCLMQKVSASFPPIPVHISHIGLFAGGRVLFGAPERNRMLDALHDACEPEPDPSRPWTPHATILIDEPDAVAAALPVLVREFRPFVGTVMRLHLCAFWPTREITSAALTGNPGAV